MLGGVKGKAGISGPCVACDKIVSFKAPSCLHCGHPNAGEEAKVAAEAKTVREATAKEFGWAAARAIRWELEKPEGELTKADLEKVRELYLGGNGLKDVTVLKELTQLTRLNLESNQLTDVFALEELTQLKGLNLRDNPALTKAQIDYLKKALPKCKIYSDFD